MELVAYNPDGTLPTNQVYDDIVTDVNITAPAIVDINNNNHAEFNYKYSGSPNESNPFSYSSYGSADMLYDSNNFYYVQSNFSGASATTFDTSIAILDKYDHSIKLRSSLPLVVSAICDISAVVNNTILVCGFNIGNKTERARLSYAFVDKSSLSVSQVHTIGGFVPVADSVHTLHDVQVIDNVVYFRSFTSTMESSATSSAENCYMASYRISGSTFADVSLTEHSMVHTRLNLYTQYAYIQNMSEAGYSNQTVVIGQNPEHPSTSGIYSYHYYIITYNNGDITISDRKILNTVDKSDYQFLPGLYGSCKIYNPKDKYYYIFYQNYYTYTYQNDNHYKGYTVIKFRFNGVDIVDLAQIKSTNTIGTSIKVHFLGARINGSDNTVDIICVNSYNNPGPLMSWRFSLTTLTRLYTFDLNFNSSVLGCRAIVIDNMIKLIHYPNGIYKNLVSLAPYYLDTYGVAGSCKISSTKALAVTSGNIGDTVRIAYEGTYHVPGVPTGSIYNTDTSYAIAKKSGVLTVSEPQQTSKVYYGSYVGDGTRGLSESNPMSITFPFEPKAIWMFGTSGTSGSIQAAMRSIVDINSKTSIKVITSKVTEVFSTNGAWRDGTDNAFMHHKMSSDRKTYYWYIDNPNTSAISYALNANGTEYHYIAFG